MIFMKLCTRIEKIWSLIHPLLGGSWTRSPLHLFAFTLNSCGWNSILATLLWSILKNQAVPNVSIWEWEKKKKKRSWLSQNLLPNIYAYIVERIMNIVLFLFLKAERIMNMIMIWFGLQKVSSWHGRVWQCHYRTKNEDMNTFENHKGSCIEPTKVSIRGLFADAVLVFKSHNWRWLILLHREDYLGKGRPGPMATIYVIMTRWYSVFWMYASFHSHEGGSHMHPKHLVFSHLTHKKSLHFNQFQ